MQAGMRPGCQTLRLAIIVQRRRLLDERVSGLMHGNVMR